MSPRTFVVGTRGSALALRQTEIVLALLRAAQPAARFHVRTIRTAGDRSRASLSEIGGRGVFVVELERALLASEIDIAVHSLKDLPTQETDGLTIAAVPKREDPRDVLISRGSVVLCDLPAGGSVGTGSPRRAAQLLAARPDLRIADIRGNVDSRIRTVEDGEYDAAVLAAAGLARLGWLGRAAQVFSPEEMLPAPGQGALAVQVRSRDGETAAVVRALEDRDARAAVTAERAFERRLGGGCHAAIAAHAVILSGDDSRTNEAVSSRRHALSSAEGNLGSGAAGVTNPDSSEYPRLHLSGLVADAAGGRLLRGELSGPTADAEALGVRLAEQLIEQGAAAILEAAS